MPHSFCKIWIHAIWSTKERAPTISLDKEKAVHNLMRKEFIDFGCPVRIINGMPDHVHSLFLLSANKSIADAIKQVKGGTTHHINQHNLLPEKFLWQTGYAAFSVSESVIEKVYRYIKNQKAHHAIKSVEQEYQEFLELHGFENEK